MQNCFIFLILLSVVICLKEVIVWNMNDIFYIYREFLAWVVIIPHKNTKRTDQWMSYKNGRKRDKVFSRI